MDIITKQGKLLFALPFSVFGIMHLMMGAIMAGMVPSFIPGGVLWVYLTGIAMIAAPVAILMNKMAKLASFLLGVMLLIFALSIHLVAVLGGDKMSMGNLLKDLALAGAAFMYSEQAEA